jgi:MFS family permease
MKPFKTGLRENWQQFTLLVVVNAFVGGMIGLERTIFPKFASSQFGLSSSTAILTFIVAFGLSKAISNYFAGKLSHLYGRKRVLVFGWILALPIPFIFIQANSWNWILFANILLGISQGLTWTSTVLMKIDLVGEKNRGFAMGLNEFAGYFSVGIVAYLSGFIANKYGITPYPFYLGIFISGIGLLLSLLFVNDTHKFVALEKQSINQKPLKHIFIETTFINKTLSTVTQAGLVNNLNDGMIWGLLPILLAQKQLSFSNIAIVAAAYPAVWGIGQLFTGKMSDHFSKKKMLFWGMFIQGLVICVLPFTSTFVVFMVISVVLGFGTALVYPTFLSAIAENTIPQQRAESMGTFRLWRDLGYVIGAIISGAVADLLGLEYAIVFIGILTLMSSFIVKWRMPKKRATNCCPLKSNNMLIS